MTDLVKLLAILALIVFLLNRKWNLGLVLVLASALLGLLFARPAKELLMDGVLAITDPLTLRLAGIVVLILTLGEILRRTARLDGMVHALEQLVPDTRVVLAIVPTLIGLLPMVGGAMFSAPMVNYIGDQIEASPERKTFINYWLRHIWEYVFPLYPSFVLGAVLLELSYQQATGLLWPLALVSAIGGVLFGMVGLKGRPRHREHDDQLTSLRELSLSIWPIALVLILALAVGVDLIVSLILTIALLAVVNRVGIRQFADILRHHVQWETVIVIFGAMVFRRVLEETGAVAAASEALIALHIPTVAAVFAVPFFAGVLSGLGTAAFAIGFPIILPLIGHSPIEPALATWAWAGGFLGVMMSPVHLCLALTRVYFQADWGPLYRRIGPATLLTAATAGLLLALT